MSKIFRSENDLIARCDCHYHAVQVEYDTEFDHYNISLWKHWTSPFPLPWSVRLRWIWYLIRDGVLQPDSVILQKTEAQALAEFIYEKNLGQIPESNSPPSVT
jgi:hypothetical protein